MKTDPSEDERAKLRAIFEPEVDALVARSRPRKDGQRTLVIAAAVGVLAMFISLVLKALE